MCQEDHSGRCRGRGMTAGTVPSVSGGQHLRPSANPRGWDHRAERSPSRVPTQTPHTALDGDCHWVSCGSARPLRTAMATCRHPRSLIREPRAPSPSAGTHSRSGSLGGLPGHSQFTGSKQGRAAHTGLGGALAPHSPSGARASAHAHRPACGALNSAPLQSCSLASAQDRPQESSHGHAPDRPRPPAAPKGPAS